MIIHTMRRRSVTAPRTRRSAAALLCAALALSAVSGCGTPRRSRPPAPPPPTAAATDPAGPQPAGATTTSPPPGVAYRDDCSKIQIAIEAHCQPRTPTPIPAGGVQDAIDAGPQTLAQVLCSAIPDQAMRRSLGSFLVYTNPAGECHYDKPYTDYAACLTLALSPYSPGRLRAGDKSGWHPFTVSGRYAGYVNIGGQTRWYRIGLSADPNQPGTLLLLSSYTRFAGPRDYRTLPAPAAYYAAIDRHARELAAYITR